MADFTKVSSWTGELTLQRTTEDFGLTIITEITIPHFVLHYKPSSGHSGYWETLEPPRIHHSWSVVPGSGASGGGATIHLDAGIGLTCSVIPRETRFEFDTYYLFADGTILYDDGNKAVGPGPAETLAGSIILEAPANPNGDCFKLSGSKVVTDYPGSLLLQYSYNLTSVSSDCPPEEEEEECSIAVTASTQTACPNETVTFTASGSDGTITWSGGGNPPEGQGTLFTTRFPTHGQRTVSASLTTSEGKTCDAQATITVKENSGAQWVARFPTSTSVSDLTPVFASAVNSFIQALQQAGATVSIAATYRPPERAYLMHYAFRIARKGLNPAKVPAHAGIDICWLHRKANGDPDPAMSKAGAEAMVVAYNIKYAPALSSRHEQRRAIDMTITWKGNLTITNGNGKVITITSKPRNGARNTDLHKVGKTYKVRKLVGDPPHWSDDGR